jgi:hypothetical protein
MKITLKSIKHSESLSQETNAFTSNVYADGKLVAYASNSGHGGNTMIHASKDRDTLKVVEDYCLSLPGNPYTEFGGGITESNLENIVDDLLEEYLVEKDKKRFESKKKREMVKGLVLVDPKEKEKGSYSYSLVTLKGNTIAQILSTPQGIVTLTNTIKKYKSQGFKIENTNIPTKILNVE